MIVIDPQNFVMLSVKDIIGTRLLTAEQGKTLYTEIKKNLDEGKRVSLDFEEVGIIAGPFLNNAIGVLYRDFSEEDLYLRLNYFGISRQNLNVISIVKKNAIEFYLNR